jgi:hypothetical protein
MNKNITTSIVLVLSLFPISSHPSSSDTLESSSVSINQCSPNIANNKQSSPNVVANSKQALLLPTQFSLPFHSLSLSNRAEVNISEANTTRRAQEHVTKRMKQGSVQEAAEDGDPGGGLYGANR